MLRRVSLTLACALIATTALLAVDATTASAQYDYEFTWGAGTGNGSVGSGNGEFNFPSDAVVANGSVYVTDSSNNRVQRFTDDAQFIGRWGANGGDGTSGNGDGEFTSPMGIDADAAGNIYVADADNNRIQKFDANGNYVTRWGMNGGDGSAGTGDGEFVAPFSVAVDRDAGDVYVADIGNSRVQVFDSDGNYLRQFTPTLPTDTFPPMPASVTVAPSGHVFVTDLLYHRIVETAADGQVLNSWGSQGPGPAQFSSPFGIRAASDGNLFVADFGNDRVQKFDAAGNFLDQFGSTGNGDGQLHGPTGVGVDGAGHAFVVDRGNQRVSRFVEHVTGGQVEISGSTLIVRARPGDANDISVAQAGGRFTVSDASAGLGATTPCTSNGPAEVSCPAEGVTLVVVDTLDGDDRASVDTVTPAQLLGGSGNDALSGSSAADALFGDASLGADGGAPGNDTLAGGDSDDLLVGGEGDDSMVGGPGTDRIDYSGATAGVAVDLANAAAQDTGAAGTDTISTVEDLNGSPQSDKLSGSADSNRIDGGAGDDAIAIRDQSPDAADCDAGNDTVTADRSDATEANCETVLLPPLADTTPPALTKLYATSIRYRSGGTIFYTLSEPATVEFAISRPVVASGKQCDSPDAYQRDGDRLSHVGRRHGHREHGHGHGWGHGPRVCVLLKAVGKMSVNGTAGSNRFGFSGRIGGVQLRPDLYALTATPADAAGNVGRSKSILLLVHG